MKWRRFLLVRSARLVAVLAALVVLTFLMVHLVPGDPARAIAGTNATEAAVKQTRQELGLERSLPRQFQHYVSDLSHGSLGQSYKTRESVNAVIADRIGPTAQLAVFGMVLICVIGIPLGLIGAVLTRSGGRGFEVGFSAGTGAMAAVPHYLTATFLVFLFAVTWQLLPVAGAATLSAAVLPAIAIALRPAAMVARIVRVRTLEVLEQPYARAARSKRLSAATFYGRHIFPNAMTSTFALAGVLFASLVGGAVVVEQVFARPGLGTTLVRSVLVGDYPVVQGITLLLGVTVVVVNALADVLLAIVDPQTLEGES